MPYHGGKYDYWKSHGTMAGKRDMYSEGSVADRGGNNETPGYTYTPVRKMSSNKGGSMPYMDRDSTQYKSMGKPKYGMKKKKSMGYGFGGKGAKATVASRYSNSGGGGSKGNMSY